LHTKTSNTKRILTLDAPKRRSHFSKLFKGRAERNEGWHQEKALNGAEAAQKSWFRARVDFGFAEEQTVLVIDDGRISADG
jgi:hypothetical protein